MAHSKIFYLVVLLQFVKAQEWNEPGFYPNPEVEDLVEFLDATDPSSQIIKMDENIKDPITIAFLNYEGTQTPEISKFTEPSSSSGSLLGAIFEKGDNKLWKLIITVTQDFDNKGKPNFRYVFEIVAAGVSRTVYLFINNIDDETPIIAVSDNPCKIEENYVGPSTCKCSITDADGVMNGVMKYTLKPEGTNEKFMFENEEELKDGTKAWNVILHVLDELDYETVSLHVFDFYAEDSGGNVGEAKIVVQVQDIPDEPPRWVTIFASQQFPEKQPQTFSVEAMDGDVSLNWEINYQLETEWPELFSVGEKTGVIAIQPIDRDALKRETFTFKLVAYEADDLASRTDPQNVVIIVEDVNDNIPVITLNKVEIKIPERKLKTLDIDIEINDIDLGDHANYEVSFRDDVYNKAFQIVPDRGYQKWNFRISVVDAEALDYEAEDWRKIELQIISVEVADQSHRDTKTVTVELTNWNDEMPIFEKEEYVIEIHEDIGINERIEQVLATDRDVDDKVIHSLGTSFADKFSIDTETGLITTKIAGALDYEKQTVVSIQVQAQDTLTTSEVNELHKTFAQLTINVIDVNDEQPRISVPPGTIKVKENSPDGTLVNQDVKITATDVDTEAELEFSIDWATSYAVKNGQRAKPEDYEGCIKIDEGSATKVTAEARLIIKEIHRNNTPDYELFDTLYIALTVTDLKQNIGIRTDEVMITINIEDENDSEPIFTEQSINSYKNVVEGPFKRTLITTMVATDADGPNYNKVSYSLNALNEKHETWVVIDPETGELFVDDAIDADLPIHELKYEVIASDNKHDTKLVISIEVTDTNSKEPKPFFEPTVEPLEEKSIPGTLVKTISATDADRDAMYNTPWYRFSSSIDPETRTFFSINSATGEITVNDLGEKKLDRDFGTPRFTIPFIVSDNINREGSGIQLSVEESFTIVLTDKNDQPPMIDPAQFSASENDKKGKVIGVIKATDKDEPNTDNTKIGFNIENIEKGENAAKEPPDDLFEHTPNTDWHSGETTLIANYDLKGYYGTYLVTIRATDSGSPPQSTSEIITVVIERYNFEKPQFIFPESNQPIYLSKSQSLNQALFQYNGQILSSFNATDNQNEKWALELSIEPEHENFILYSTGKSQAQLQMKSLPNYDNTYELTLVADCKCIGVGPTQDRTIIHIRFIDENSEPYFEENEVSVQFVENRTGVGKIEQLPKATYNKEGEDWDLFNIYYFLIDDASKSFEINKISAELKLMKMLDREVQSQHTLVVQASQKPSGNLVPGEGSLLTVLVEVEDINDNPPKFDNSTFSGSVKQSDDLHKIITKTQASDPDEKDSMRFTIVENTMDPNGEGIGNIQEPFYINTGTGEIHLNFSVQFNMNGYFRFSVNVKDEVDHEDTASVTIYVVSESSKSRFTFGDDLTSVKSKEIDIKAILEDQFARMLGIGNIMCSIENIQEALNENGEALPTEADVFAHFLDPKTSEPVSSGTIQETVNALENYASLKQEFLSIGLHLINVLDNPEDPAEESYLIWLIGMSAALGTLCVALIIAYIIKTRSLTKRLNKLSTTKFGSQDSGLNRIGAAAPNTNKHAIEGSNPVYNEEKKMPDFDTTSVGSGDSDLIGIEDNPNFQYSPEFYNGHLDTKFK